MGQCTRMEVQMEDSINIRGLFGIIRTRWMLITTLTLLMAAVGGGFSYFISTPKYEASTQILVNQKSSSNQLDTTQMRGNIELINTYSVIIKSPAILDKVIEKLKLEASIEQLTKSIKVNSQSESQIFSLTVQSSRPERAVLIANTISETFQREVRGIMNVDNVNILAKAVLAKDPKPVSPNPIVNIAISIVIGFMFGIGLSFLLEFLDNSLRTTEDVAVTLGLPVLGTIYKIQKQPLKSSQTEKRIGVERIETQVEA